MSEFNPFVRREWHLAHSQTIEFGPLGRIIGILNVTPDSFSDGGQFLDLDDAITHADLMISHGANVLDVGGESSRPGAQAVSAKIEQERIIPVIKLLSRRDVLISVDTTRAETAAMAIEAGAHIINDIWGLHHEPDLGRLAARHRAGMILMHNGRNREKPKDMIEDQFAYLSQSIETARSLGIDRAQIVIDPGFGFAKDAHQNIELLSNLERLHMLGFPVLAGTSRKRFIGHITGRSASERDAGTAATNVIARMKGAAFFRVHDVPSTKDAIAVADAVLVAGATHA